MGGREYPETKRSIEYVKSPSRPDSQIFNPSSLTLQYPANYACAIQLEDSNFNNMKIIVLTGLNGKIKKEVKVVKYYGSPYYGSQEELPDLNDKRTKHGCSSFTKDITTNKVTKAIIYLFWHLKYTLDTGRNRRLDLE